MRVFNYLTLLVALTISACAAFYSILGLTAIFSAAFIPIVIMGGVLELGKITGAVWLHLHWNMAKWWMKFYMVPAVLALMFITSMGIFGFLSKAHIEKSVNTSDNTITISQIENKIQREQSSITDSETVLKQLDGSVQALINYDRIRGKDGAIAVREGQKEERESLSSIIDEAQIKIDKLENEKAALSVEQAKLDADVGPIRYVAALIYGDNPDENLLERAVRYMILLIVSLFDPLAIVMVLAAASGLSISGSKNFFERKEADVKKK